MGDTLDPDMKLDGVAYGRGTHENTFLNFFLNPKGFPLKTCVAEPTTISIMWNQLLLSWK